MNFFLRQDLAEEVEGDLEEKFFNTVKSKSSFWARLSYWYQVVNYLRPFAFRKHKYYSSMNTGLFQNYFKVGIRNILKYKTFSAINIFGLALAMAVCMLLILMLADQKRYDHFHEKKDRIFRILSSTAEGRQPYATSPFPLAKALKENYAIVEEATNLTPGIGGDVLYNQQVAEMRGYFADPSFFRVFSFVLEKGDPKTALRQPNSAVISGELASQLFGDQNPLGKVFEFYDRGLPFPQQHDDNGSPPVAWGSFTITGTIDDSKYKSHLKFDVLVSASSLPLLYSEGKIPDRTTDWEFYFRSYNYVLLRPDKTATDLAVALNDLVARTYKDIKSDVTRGFQLTPQLLKDVQLGLKGNDTNNRFPLEGYYFLGLLAIIIMVSASLNYTNLSVARALTRAKEIGVRKVTGAKKGAIALQFLSESIIVSLLACVAAVALLFLIRPAFKNLWVNQFLEFELPQTFSVYTQFFGFALFIGLIAGAYPALHLSGYQPVKVLKGLPIAGTGKLGLRKVLSVSQFAISLFFIVTAILIFRQFKFFMEFDYGFNYSNVINVPLQGADFQKTTTLFNSIAEIESTAGSDIIPATGTNNGIALKKPGTADEFLTASIIMADPNFVKTLNIQLIAGKTLPSDSSHFVLLNETAVRKLGFENPAQIIGESLELKWGDPVRVAGVVKDFHYLLLINGREMGPLVLKNQPKEFKYITVKLAGSDPMRTIEQLEAKWKTIDPIHPFQYRFYDEQLASTHRGVFDLVTVLGCIAFLAIVIACLGLLGMTTYAAERKTKEVGIRKVMGASHFNIAYLLSKEFVLVLIIAVCIGAPLSFFVNNLWLQKMATRVDFGWGTVLMGIWSLLFLGLLTIGSQTLRVSKANPLDSLKAE